MRKAVALNAEGSLPSIMCATASWSQLFSQEYQILMGANTHNSDKAQSTLQQLRAVDQSSSSMIGQGCWAYPQKPSQAIGPWLPIISYTETRVKETIEQKLRGLTSSLIDETSEHKAKGAVRLARNMQVVGPSDTDMC